MFWKPLEIYSDIYPRSLSWKPLKNISLEIHVYCFESLWKIISSKSAFFTPKVLEFFSLKICVYCSESPWKKYSKNPGLLKILEKSFFKNLRSLLWNSIKNILYKPMMPILIDPKNYFSKICDYCCDNHWKNIFFYKCIFYNDKKKYF